MNSNLLDNLLAGRLSPDEFESLRHVCDTETLRRILDGDTKLRNAIVSLSTQKQETSLTERIYASLAKEHSTPSWITFFMRWGLPLGVVILGIAIIGTLPVFLEVGFANEGVMSPLLLAVGGVLVVGLGAAYYLEYGDRR